MMTRYAVICCAMLTAVALAGCSGYDPGPAPTPTTGESRSASTDGSLHPTPSPRKQRTSAPPEAYSWGLPPSDTSVAGNDGPAYAALQEGCSSGQAYLDSVAPEGYGFRSPLNVVLFAAGLKLCDGDRAGARTLYDYGAARYGLSGLPEGKPECELYKSVRSVLEQKPRTSFPCPGGQPPQELVGPTGLLDDPLTMDLDESIPVESESPPATSETPGIPGTDPTPSESGQPASPTPATPPVPTP